MTSGMTRGPISGPDPNKENAKAHEDRSDVRTGCFFFFHALECSVVS